MKVVIIEDEQLTSEHLERLLLRLRPDIEISAIIETVSESIAFLKNARGIDLIFSDIHLADGNSFEIFDTRASFESFRSFKLKKNQACRI
jgi:two-component system LytT family response regulator